MDLTEIMSGLKLPADARVLVGVETADDAGVFVLEGANQALVHTADFITPVCDDPYWFGRVAAANSLSDIYAMGGRPLTALNLCCFPPSGVSKHELTEILRGGLETITEAGAALVGGHTIKDNELKYGLSVTGICEPQRLTPNSGARDGDRLILTKPLGTGTVINAHRAGKTDTETLMKVVGLMAVLNRVAAEVMVEYGCKGATDVTGFGLAGHAWEMAKASGVRLVIDAESIPLIQEAREIIAVKGAKAPAKTNGRAIEIEPSVALDIQMLCVDPQTSGGLLIAVPADKAEAMVRELKRRGVEAATLIGRVEAAAAPSVLIGGSR